MMMEVSVTQVAYQVVDDGDRDWIEGARNLGSNVVWMVVSGGKWR